MNYRTLLVPLGHDVHCAARTGVAIELAQALDCHLVGLAPTDLVDLPAVPRAADSLAGCAALVWDAVREQAERAADLFGDTCRAAGLRSFEAVIDECDRTESLLRHARCNDLTIASQADPSSAHHGACRALVEQVVLRGARPTLLLPIGGCAPRIVSHALVAWDDSREASRAVADALPLLRLAKRVDVVSWHEGTKGDDESLRDSLALLRQWLLRQRVTAQTRIEPLHGSIADTMLAHARDVGADLIVMGAYGHARWAERVLGGATGGLLAAMTVPVLMSH